MDKLLLSILFFLSALPNLSAQNRCVKGVVVDAFSKNYLPYVNVAIMNGSNGSTTDSVGQFFIGGIESELVNITASFVGYKPVNIFEVRVPGVNCAQVRLEMEPVFTELNEVIITSNAFEKSEENATGMNRISATEIYRNPGGNRDISKVLQILPGVATSASFRNDLIIRGGAPNENKFYLDGVEIPNINHFATQGSSGGPVGMLNVRFIENVDLFTGAVGAQRGNALSSTMELTQKSLRPDKIIGSFMLGSSDAALAIEAPVINNGLLLFSLRRSYLQYLFSALKLPFLPTYNDAQFKLTQKLGKRTELTVIGLGAVDDFSLNYKANEKEDDVGVIERNSYILNYLPKNTQWNYTVGGVIKHVEKNNIKTFVISRNHLNNKNIKYLDQEENDSQFAYKYESEEIENKFRFENLYRNRQFKLIYGGGVESAKYTKEERVLNFYPLSESDQYLDFSSDLELIKSAVFIQASQRYLNSRLLLSVGLRSDFNNYNTHMLNPLRQVSPRFSSSYSISERVNVNMGLGRIGQLPALTVLGFTEAAVPGVYSNQNTLKYITNDHVSLGLDYAPSDYLKMSLEGFYKLYSNYPVSIEKNISLANLGSDFGVIGNEKVNSSGGGMARGIEFSAQQKLSKKIYGITSITWVNSRFSNGTNNQIPSSWDSGLIANITAGRKFKNGLELGIKFRYQGGAPYTPFNESASSLKTYWDAVGQGIPDWTLLNSQRLNANHALDLRIDKTWYFKRLDLNAYIDIQNIYGAKVQGIPIINMEKGNQGELLTNPADPSKYSPYYIDNSSGTILPSLGLMMEF